MTPEGRETQRDVLVEVGHLATIAPSTSLCGMAGANSMRSSGRIGRDVALLILLVEDDDDNREMLSRRLQKRGLEVVCAVDGEEAVECARRDRPLLVLMDMSLPKIDGWEATRRLKADPLTAPIPIIALTAHAMRGDRERALEVGCDEYDTKPIVFARLIEKIEALLGVAL